ncbi:hypothetical protein SAMN05446037_100697 [Anaerovirgula multivorans]|uniref:GIY-YIG domain-containing protein n=1 Tax=Anaerovirgula multivorans TaxID=312168 RepID=A0A239CS88_9FIRM|nr:hypothetical protein [Anaerovirgula multivorans]SNS22364.1 hypothetical protein SAMN05446037_100697 [Anaerovirgula multivorans]
MEKNKMKEIAGTAMKESLEVILEKSSSIDTLGNLNMVYFLIKDNQIIYIGRSVTGLASVLAKAKDIEADSYYITLVEPESLDALWAYQVNRFKPVYNNYINRCNATIARSKLRDKYRADGNVMNLLERECGLPRLYDGSYLFCNVVEAMDNALSTGKIIKPAEGGYKVNTERKNRQYVGGDYIE